tara:strand:- start:80 stop:391 length:312 start_codon:yes stop_codon:yes gene_type:complete
MKKILFLVTSLFLLSSCNTDKDKYVLEFYPEPSSTYDLIVKEGLVSLEDCQSVARELLNEYPNGDYSCGTKCEKEVIVIEMLNDANEIIESSEERYICKVTTP